MVRKYSTHQTAEPSKSYETKNGKTENETNREEEKERKKSPNRILDAIHKVSVIKIKYSGLNERSESTHSKYIQYQASTIAGEHRTKACRM